MTKQCRSHSQLESLPCCGAHAGSKPAGLAPGWAPTTLNLPSPPHVVPVDAHRTTVGARACNDSRNLGAMAPLQSVRTGSVHSGVGAQGSKPGPPSGESKTGAATGAAARAARGAPTSSPAASCAVSPHSTGSTPAALWCPLTRTTASQPANTSQPGVQPHQVQKVGGVLPIHSVEAAHHIADQVWVPAK